MKKRRLQMSKRIALAKNRNTSEYLIEDLSEGLKKNIYIRTGHMSFQEPEKINAGSKGTVYNLDNGLVFKLTSDASEAFAAYLLKLSPNECFYTVLDVFRIDTVPELYGIVLEDLVPSDKEWQLFGDIFNEWHSLLTNALEERNPEKDINIYLVPKTYQLFENTIHKKYGTERFSKQLSWLKCIQQHLQKLGILYLDLHGGNIMKDPKTGNHVLIYMGYSKTPPVSLDLVVDPEKQILVAKKLIILSKILSKHA